MDAVGDSIIRAVVGLMLASAFSGLLVFRFTPPFGIRSFWLSNSFGPKRLVFYFVLLLACWLLPFSLVAVVLTGIPAVSALFVGLSLELRLLLLFGSSWVLCLLMFWYTLKHAQA